MEEFDLENPFQELHESETVASLFEAESDHMPVENCRSFMSGDFDASFRQNAVSLIMKAQFSCGLDPFITYLAINYLDRFVSSLEIPQGKPQILKLVAISCLSLAAKMKKIVFSLNDVQSEEGFIFDSETVRRMELLILGALKWRMRSITPFSFVSFLLAYFKFNDPSLMKCLKARATEVILKAQNDVKLLRYKPSIIAASALLSASHELLPIQFPSFRKEISTCIFVNNDKLFDCFAEMQEVVMEGYASTIDTSSLYSSGTPLCVLDRHCSSSESEKTSTGRLEPELKRPKMSDFCKLKTFQLSQIQQC
ncbi:putative cyclin-D6-1 [Aristolochia californica]|uniref:putative cyclin-D6-1 n=1 Tax=Aristolochia californica TaxID=171875 RepID=UPI0035D8230F